MSNTPARHATLHASAAEIITGVTEPKVHSGPDVIAVLDITAVAGTLPTLDVIIEELDPASGKYSTIDTFPQANSVSTVRRVIVGPHGPFLRASYTIGGTTPSFTFSLGILSG